MAEFRWTGKRTRAALDVAEDRNTDVVIAQRAGISVSGLKKWKGHPVFAQRVQEHLDAARSAVMAEGVADTMVVVRELNDAFQGLIQIREARKLAYANAPGGSTGYITQTFRSIITKDGTNVSIPIYEIDTSLIDRMMKVPEQVRKFLGDWTEKRDVTTGGSPLDFTTLVKEALDRGRQSDGKGSG